MVRAGACTIRRMTKRVLFGRCAVIAIVNEASGERAMHHVMEPVPYPRIRPIAECQGHFRVSEVRVGFAREYGFSSAAIELFPSPQRSWAPTLGELWLMTATEQKQPGDIHDLAVSVAANSQNGIRLVKQ